MECTATIQVGYKKIIISGLNENEINNLEKIVQKLYEDKDNLKEFVQALKNKGYDTKDFKLSYDSLNHIVGNLSLRQAVAKFFNPNSEIFKTLGQILEEDNILIEDSVIGNGSKLAYSNGTFKLILKSSDFQSTNQTVLNNVKDTLKNFIILNWIKTVITGPNSELKTDTISEINQIMTYLNSSLDKIKDDRILKVIEYLNTLSGEEKMLNFLAYYYGDSTFNKAIGNKLKNPFNKFIEETYVLESPEQILTEDTTISKKLKDLLKDGNKIYISDLNGESLQDLLIEFNNSQSNLYLGIDYKSRDYYKLKTLTFAPLFGELIEMIGVEFYGPNTNLIRTYRGYDIVEFDGKYYLSKHGVLHSLEMLDQNKGVFRTWKDKKYICRKIDERLSEPKKMKSGIVGDWLDTRGYWNDILTSNHTLTTLRVPPGEKLKKGSILKIINFEGIQFNHDFQSLNKWKSEILKKQGHLYYGNLIMNASDFLNDLGILDFFKDDDQKLRYKEILDSTDKAEAFFLRCHDLILDLIDAGKLNKNTTLFTADSKTRHGVIDQVLSEMSNINYIFYQVDSDPDESGNISITKLERAERDYKMPRYNIKSDLIAVIDHLEKHFGVKCHVVNDQDITTGIGPTKIKVDPSARAFILNGEVYVNIDKADAGDAIHEYSHLVLSIMKTNPETQKKYYDLVSLVTNLPDYKERVDSYRKNKDFRSEIDLQEEIFVTVFGEYFGNKIMLNYYTDSALDLALRQFRENFKDMIIRAFALGDNAKLLFQEQLSNTSVQEALTTFGTMLWNQEDAQPISKEVQQQSIVSRRTSNYIARLIEEGQKSNPSESYLIEICK